MLSRETLLTSFPRKREPSKTTALPDNRFRRPHLRRALPLNPAHHTNGGITHKRSGAALPAIRSLPPDPRSPTGPEP
jgi:hypothetical protein